MSALVHRLVRLVLQVFSFQEAHAPVVPQIVIYVQPSVHVERALLGIICLADCVAVAVQ